MSFVYEQRLDNNAKGRFDNKFWQAVSNALASLEAHENDAREKLPTQGLAPLEAPSTSDAVACLIQSVSHSLDLRHELFPTILQLFISHMLYVRRLDLKERARPRIFLPSKLLGLLTCEFLPKTFLALERAASILDLDGRVFATLLDSILRDHATSLHVLVGAELAMIVEDLWKTYRLPPPDYAALRRQFPAPTLTQEEIETEHSPFQLLPFKHPLFSEELAAIGIDAEELSNDEEDESDDEASATHLEFNTLFDDTQHWHNHKRAILPSHLGGNDSMVPMDEWQRKRQLRSEQRFMSKLQWQAETLTGALGTPLQQMVIPSAAIARKSRILPSIKAEVRRFLGIGFLWRLKRCATGYEAGQICQKWCKQEGQEGDGLLRRQDPSREPG